MADMNQDLKKEVAKRSAKLFVTQMAGLPTDVQLLTVDLLTQTLFMTGVKAERRLEILDKWQGAIRKSVKAEMKKRKPSDG